MLRPIAFAAFLLAAAPAAAQKPNIGQRAPTGPEPVTFILSKEVVLLSDYRFRGVSRSDEDPAAQAGFMFNHGSGFYAGTRVTTLGGRDGFRLRDPGFGDQGGAQLDLYAGFVAEIGGGFDVDAGVMAYVFAGGRGNTDHVEPYARISYSIGPAYLSAGAKYAPSQAGTGHEDMLYLYGEANVSLPSSPWSASVELGHQDWRFGRCGLPHSPQPCPGGMAGLPNYGGYWAWSAGGRYNLRLVRGLGTTIGLSYVDTDLPSAPGRDAGLVASLEIAF